MRRKRSEPTGRPGEHAVQFYKDICGYSMSSFGRKRDDPGFQDVCRQHTHVLTDASPATP
jgi:hypothetical protein